MNEHPRETPPEEERADAVAWQLLVPLMLIALIAGMHSPFTALMVQLAPAWYPPILPASPALVLYLAQLLTSTLMLMIAGVPAAIHERLFTNGRSTFSSMGVWLLGTALLALPALDVIRQLL